MKSGSLPDLPKAPSGLTPGQATNPRRLARRGHVFPRTTPLALKRRSKAIKVAQALLAGKNQVQAALAAGAKKGPNLRKDASRLAHSEDVREELENALKKYRLDADRAAKEIDKGLRGSELGKHDSYLQLFMRVGRYLGAEAPQPGQTFNTVVLQKIYQNAVDRGVV